MAKAGRLRSEAQRAAARANIEKARAAKRASEEAAAAAPDRPEDEQDLPPVSDEQDEADEAAVRGETVADIDGEAVDRRKRLLADLDPETAALFTDAELEQIEREERQKALAAQKKQAMSDVRAMAAHAARAEHGLIPADTLRSEEERRRLNEPVTFRVRVPGDGAGHLGRNGIRVDGYLYQHGRDYTRSRAVFESLQSNHYRIWFNEVQFKTLDQHKRGNSAWEILAETMPQFEVRA